MHQLPALEVAVDRLLPDLLHEAIRIGAEEVIQNQFWLLLLFVDGRGDTGAQALALRLVLLAVFVGVGVGVRLMAEGFGDGPFHLGLLGLAAT